MSKKTGNNIRKLKVKKAFLYILRFLISIAPLVVAVAGRWEHYTRSVHAGISLAAGGVIAAVLIVLKVLKFMPKNVHRVIKSGVTLLVVYLLRDLLDDAVLLCACYFLGELLDWAILTIPIKRLEERISSEYMTDLTTEKVSASIETILNKKLGSL